MVAGPGSYRGHPFPSLARSLHDRYTLVRVCTCMYNTYIHGPHRFYFKYTINSSWEGAKQSRDIELDYIKEEGINFSVHVIILLNIKLD